MKTALIAAALAASALCGPVVAGVSIFTASDGAGVMRPDSTGAAPGDTARARMTAWLDHIRMTGNLEGHFRGMGHRDAFVSDSGVMTDIYFRRVELGIETSLAGWATAIAVLNSEFIGDPLRQGDEKITVDEVHFDLRERGTPVYFVFGKRTLPFGEFENALVTDPMTQDAYEIKKVGATIGFSGPFDVDLSATVYKGDELMSHLFQSALFDTNRVRRDRLEIDNMGSFVVAASITPVENALTLFASFSSEPGTDRRNTSANAGLSLKLPFFANVAIDLEYMKALERELYLLDGARSTREDRESVLAATVSYSFAVKRSILHNRGLYRARRQYRRAHPIEAALRFERFGDDGLSGQFGAYSVRNRYLAGGRYTFYESGDVAVYLGLEYRRTEFRVPLGQASAVNPSNDEGYVAFGLDF